MRANVSTISSSMKLHKCARMQNGMLSGNPQNSMMEELPMSALQLERAGGATRSDNVY